MFRHTWVMFIIFEENPSNKQSCWFNFLHPGETLQRGKLFAFILWKMHNRGMLNVGSSVETRKETFCSRVSCKKTFPDDELKERPLNDKATHVDLLLFWAKTVFTNKCFKVQRIDHWSFDKESKLTRNERNKEKTEGEEELLTKGVVENLLKKPRLSYFQLWVFTGRLSQAPKI